MIPTLILLVYIWLSSHLILEPRLVLHLPLEAQAPGVHVQNSEFKLSRLCKVLLRLHRKQKLVYSFIRPSIHESFKSAMKKLMCVAVSAVVPVGFVYLTPWTIHPIYPCNYCASLCIHVCMYLHLCVYIHTTELINICTHCTYVLMHVKARTAHGWHKYGSIVSICEHRLWTYY